jgi:flagellar hook-basal body complex protein FliE
MADAIAPISTSFRPIPPVTGEHAAPSEAFADTLKTAMADATAAQQTADAAARDFAAGKTTDVAATMIAMEQAAISFQLVLQVRNRLLEAYQEIQRIQV